jgi:hypothetical protein
MSFRADHDAVRQFSRTIGDLTDDADQAVPYPRDHLGIGYDKSLEQPPAQDARVRETIGAARRAPCAHRLNPPRSVSGRG